MSENGVVAVRSAAGMLIVWCPAYFHDVDSYDAWEARVDERMEDAIAAGELVPVNIG
jgi:hypothetical protein